jgi:hypothetical protein
LIPTTWLFYELNILLVISKGFPIMDEIVDSIFGSKESLMKVSTEFWNDFISVLRISYRLSLLRIVDISIF